VQLLVSDPTSRKLSAFSLLALVFFAAVGRPALQSWLGADQGLLLLVVSVVIVTVPLGALLYAIARFPYIRANDV
jgi:hypothetical protein